MVEAERPALQAIEHCELFAFLGGEDRQRLAADCEIRSVSQGNLIAREGAIGTELFVLIDGIIEVFTETGGEEVILARLDQAGDHVGEQALKGEGEGRRTASLRALADTTLVVVPKAPFAEAMALNPALAEHVHDVGQRQARQLSLVERSVMYRALATFDQEKGWSRDEHYEDGEVVFREGDDGEFVYVIRSGNARITKLEDGEEIVLAVLHEGQTFGELAVMDSSVRQATVSACGPLDLVAFDRDRFLQATGQVPELHEYLGTLKRVYAFGDGLATQFDGEFRGEPALVTIVKLQDDREAIIHHAKGLYSASVETDEQAEISVLDFEDSQRRILRTLALKDGHLVRVHAEGPWSELDRVHAGLLESLQLDDEQQQRFVETGSVFESAEIGDLCDPESVLCNCLQIRRRTLESVISRGAETLEDVMSETGATSVCGGCTGRIADLVGSVGLPVQLVETIDAGREVRSFRLRAIPQDDDATEPLRTGFPGQHVVISAEIDNHWVHRPYTISSAAGCTDWREITVKREPNGLLSNWLFSEPTQLKLRLSHPKGHFWADLDRPEPMVCIVAGIGVTPALAIARSVAESSSPRRLHIDYSARTDLDFSFREELDQLAGENESITVNYRCTGRGQRLTDAHLVTLNDDHPQASFFICGPSAFQLAAQSGLTALKVRPERVHVEVFTPIGHAPSDVSAVRSPGDNWRSIAVIGLALLYVLQDFMAWPLAALAEAQQSLTYSTVTGLMLIALMGYQWVLPTLRLRGQLARSAVHYRWHKYLGVLAPVLLFLHSVSLGYAYTLVLSAAWLGNAVIGALDKTVIGDEAKRARYEALWLVAHVTLSSLILVLASYHIYIAFAYK